MSAYVFNDLWTLRRQLAEGRSLFDVHTDDDGVRRWRQSSANDDWQVTDGVPLSSLKPFFFAEREAVFVFDGQQFRTRLPDSQPSLFWGVKACDAAALAVQDRFFANDEHYQRRRQQAVIVAIDCLQPCQGGFCPLTQSGPFVQDGADLVITPHAGQWLLHSASAVGEHLLMQLAGQLTPPTPVPTAELQTLRATLAQDCIQAFGDLTELAQGLQRIQQGQVNAAEWEQLALQCLSCSGCVNLCPTCSCFTSHDRPTADGFQRERIWDSCLYDGFQREASGHHPSPTPGARTARYWFHKFSPAFMAQQGRLGCTGCGRCDRVCPGVIGATTVLRRLACPG